MEIFWIILTVVVMCAGLAGVFLPIVPGIPLIFCCYVAYGFISGWKAYGLASIVAWGIVTAIMAAIDLYAGSFGAKRYGATRYGFWGAVAGGIIGAVIGNLPGLIVGPFVGAAAGELLAGRSSREALLAGWGTFAGFVAGTFVKFIVASVMIGTFLWQVIMAQ